MTGAECEKCLYRFPHGIRPQCEAFPAGIPAWIQTGEVSHTRPHPGDGGIRFVNAAEATLEDIKRTRNDV